MILIILCILIVTFCFVICALYKTIKKQELEISLLKQIIEKK